MKGENMNSVEMLGNILRSELMQRYYGVGEISLPFSLKDKRTAMFLFIESQKMDAIRAEGIFVRDGEECNYEESAYETAGLETELQFAEDFTAIVNTGLEISDLTQYKTQLQVLYDAYDSMAGRVFADVNDLTPQMRQAVIEYGERLALMSDPLRLALYYHYSPEFMEWCMDICTYVQMTS